MADTVVKIGENSPEFVALLLFREIAWIEGKSILTVSGGNDKPDRAWILDTYAQCRRAVSGLSPEKKQNG